ncbi:MAG: hypothetical protein OXD31_17025 [Chloroflexi bacterium]|nr:hypothetical protein [Chloroflexota bacterium]
MKRKDMHCETCSGAGLTQRYNWRKTNLPGTLMCNICHSTTDFRFKHAELSGGNGWLGVIERFGRTVLQCRRDGKIAYPDWDKAQKAISGAAGRAYYNRECGFIHLTKTQIRHP